MEYREEQIQVEPCDILGLNDCQDAFLKIGVDDSGDVYVSIVHKKHGLVSVRLCASGMPHTFHTRQALKIVMDAIAEDNHGGWSPVQRITL